MMQIKKIKKLPTASMFIIMKIHCAENTQASAGTKFLTDSSVVGTCMLNEVSGTDQD
jgi:hypothetical protein